MGSRPSRRSPHGCVSWGTRMSPRSGHWDLRGLTTSAATSTWGSTPAGGTSSTSAASGNRGITTRAPPTRSGTSMRAGSQFGACRMTSRRRARRSRRPGCRVSSLTVCPRAPEEGGRAAALALAPFAWVAAEWGRGHLFGGFPWGLLGYTQYARLPAIQVAELGGVYAVSFVVLSVNAAVAGTVVLPWRRAVVGIALGGA